MVLCLAFQQGREVMGGRGGHCSQPKYKTPKMSVNACIWGFKSGGLSISCFKAEVLHKIKKKQGYHMCLRSIART